MNGVVLRSDPAEIFFVFKVLNALKPEVHFFEVFLNLCRRPLAGSFYSDHQKFLSECLGAQRSFWGTQKGGRSFGDFLPIFEFDANNAGHIRLVIWRGNGFHHDS